MPPLAIPLDSLGAAWDLLRSGETAIVADIQGDDPLARDYRVAVAKYGLHSKGERSWMMVPMVMHGRTVGVILVFHDEPNMYTAHHAQLARAMADQAAVAIENARLYEQAQQTAVLEQRETERTRELLTVLAIAHDVASVLELEPLLNLILDQLKVVTEYEWASLLRFEDENLVMLAGAFGAKAATGPWTYSMSTMGPAWAWERLSSGETIIIDDVESDEPLARAYQEVMANHPEMALPGAHSWMAVPLVIHDRTIGAISLLHTEPGYYTTHHAQLARAIADQAAVAMENARLYEQARHTAVLEERQRLARELHDAVTQTLFSASLIAEMVPRLWARDPEAGMQRLEDVRALTRGALAEMRTLLLELRPTAIVESDLGELLRQLAEILTGRARLPVKLSVEGEGKLPDDVQLALYRIAQEALHNIDKHAKASQVEVRLVRGANNVVLRIKDDGCGFDPRAKRDARLAHFGMTGMRDRARAVGAVFSVQSRPGHGTDVRVRWRGGQGGSAR
jgi:two-component system nitrate/nitrite sensor histidine kinase NarX